MGRQEEAAHELEILLQHCLVEPFAPAALRLLSEVYGELGREEEQRRTFQKILDVYPHSPEARSAP